MRKFTFCLMALALIIASQVAIQAQTTGSVTGTVTDPNGAVIPGANVGLKNNATGSERTTATNDRGLFIFSLVQPGSYSVTIEKSGFKKSLATDLAVEVTKEAQVTIVLEIGLPSETVTVSSAQEVINTSSPSLSNVINTRQVVDLPLPSRNPLDLAALQAGIAVIGNDTRGSSVAGLRQTATYVSQDGIDAMDNFVKTSSFFALTAPSLGSTDEFSITTGTVGSESGRGAAQVNIVTKGGSNTFHGSIFYLMRNSALEANLWLNNFQGLARPDEHQHFYGFTIGGPLYFPNFGEGVKPIYNGHDKSFFFFSYEGFREKFQTTRTRTVMTAAARTGLFSYIGAAGTPGAGVLQTVNLLPLGNFHTLNPITQAQLNAMPQPNAPGGDGFNTSGFKFNVVGTDPSDKYVFRLDHQLVKSHKLEFVYSRVHTSLYPDAAVNSIEAPFPGGVNAGQASVRNLVTGALHSEFGSISNVFRYGRQWAPVDFLRDSRLPAAPFIILASPTSNYDNTFMNQGRNTIVNQFSDNLVAPWRSHLFRFGADLENVYAYTYNDAGINKTVTLGSNGSNPDGLLPGNFPNSDATIRGRAAVVYQDLVGLLSSATATFNVTTPTSGFVPGATRERIFKQNNLAIYGQDQWRFLSNLTLNVGLRWEFEGVPTIPNGLANQPKYSDLFGISGFGNLFNPTAPAGPPPGIATQQFVSGTTGIPLYNSDWDNFAPFAGLAWSPGFEKGIGKVLFGGPGKSSIRMGYSISYLHDGFTVISNALGTGVTNPGLIQGTTNSTPTGVLTPSFVPVTTPTFLMPITDQQNFALSTFNGIFAIDPKLNTPYVQQWNVGYEREIFKDTAIEIRYTGNHAVKVWRTVDFNEVNIFENGFLNEFLHAQANLALNGNTSFADPAHGGNAAGFALPILSKFFTGFANNSGTGFASSGFIANLQANNVGSFANTLAFSNTYKANRTSLAVGLPGNFFVANPNAAFARGLSNDSMSDYNSLQVELRKRFSQGLQYQADFTWSKAMGNATDAQGNNQNDLVNFRTLRDKSLDYRRSPQDQKFRFISNVIYELPFGKGKSFLNDGGIINQLVGGWSIGGIVSWQTSPPFYITEARSTVNCLPSGLSTSNGCSVVGTPAQLTGISAADFQKNLGIFKTPAGIFFVNPDILNITTNPATGRVTSSSLKSGLMSVSAPGQYGNFPINEFVGPAYFNVDMSLVKRFRVGERIKLELKTTAINMLNHPNFAFPIANPSNTAFDSTSFGQVTQRGGSRIVHFTGTMNF